MTDRIVCAPDRDEKLLRVVADMLETDGYEAVQLREVARRAQTSLATIYKRYPTRDELILAALQSWVQRHRYAGIGAASRDPGTPLPTAVMAVLRRIFEPWERHPEMLVVYFRARSAPGGDRLLQHGLQLVEPAVRELFVDVDAEFVAEFDAVISSLVYGLLGRFSAGEIAVTDILETLDRAVHRLIRGYEADHG